MNRLKTGVICLALAASSLLGMAPASAAPVNTGATVQVTYKYHYLRTTTASAGRVVCTQLIPGGVVIYQTYIGSWAPAPWYTKCRATVMSYA